MGKKQKIKIHVDKNKISIHKSMIKMCLLRNLAGKKSINKTK